MLRNFFRVHPRVINRVRAENHRQKEHRHDRKRSCCSLEHAPDYEPPTTAGQVLQHQQRQRADTDPGTEGPTD